MRVIVLGSTGYLGSRVVKKLVELHHHVLCLTREESRIDCLLDVMDRIEVCRINDLHGYLEENAGKYDCFFNAACKYEKNEVQDIDIMEANLYVPIKVFLECLNHNVKKYITVGTGLPQEFNVYTVSKRKYAEIGNWYSNRCQAKGRSIQFCNVELENFYGKDEPENRFIADIIKKLKRNEKILLTEGSQKRDFIFIDDVVRILAELIQKEDLPCYMDLPLGTGTGVPIREIITYLKELTNSESELCFGAVPKRLFEPDSWADLKKMNEMNFHVQYDWKRGLKQII